MTFSFIVATFNRRALVSGAIESVLRENAADVEVIVADDASTDGTMEALQAQFKGRPDVVLLQMPRNGGPGVARNAAIAVARGRYFVPLDSDCELLPGALDQVRQMTQRAPGRPVIFCACVDHETGTRMDTLRQAREISVDDLVFERVQGEFIPVVDISLFRARAAAYPSFKCGGEQLLWIELLSSTPAPFFPVAVLSYRTRLADRICSAAFQAANASDMALLAERHAELLVTRGATHTSAYGHRCLAAGVYHVLAGDAGRGRMHLRRALRLRRAGAMPALLLSMLGPTAFRSAFLWFRARQLQ